jgi:hypothetical protein
VRNFVLLASQGLCSIISKSDNIRVPYLIRQKNGKHRCLRECAIRLVTASEMPTELRDAEQVHFRVIFCVLWYQDVQKRTKRQNSWECA